MSQKLRLALAAGLGALAVANFVGPAGANASTPGSAGTSAASTGNPISLVGEGSDDLAKEIPAWSNELYPGNLSLSYNVVGGLEGRADYLNGIGDFVISGVPWQGSELAQLPSNVGGMIGAPIEASAVGFGLAWGPAYTLNRSCSPSDQSCIPSSKYAGTLDIPNTTMVDMMWHAIATTSPSTCGCLADPGILNATAGQIPQGNDSAPPTLSVQSIPPVVGLLRSEPSETSYYLQQFAQTASPGEFAKVPGFAAPITEYLQGEFNGQFTQTYQGVQSEVDYMTNEAGNVVADYPQGIIAPLPPSGLTGANYYLPPGVKFTGSTPAYPPSWVGVENASGQWVTPNTATINAAIGAGGGKPLYALSNRVSGPTPAYPLTYINDLYAPAHGLSPDQAESIATIIRYGATAGQDAMPAQNDGQLSPGLVQQALAAANQVIASNCTGSDKQVTVSSSIGRYAPVVGPLDGKTAGQRQAELASIGPMLHCSPSASSAGRTTPSGSGSGAGTNGGSGGTAGVLSGSSGYPSTLGASGSASSGSAGSQPAGAAQSSGAQPNSNSPPGSGGTGASGPITLLSLPLAFPWSGLHGYNQLVGMVIGGLAFLLLWRSRASLGGLFRP